MKKFASFLVFLIAFTSYSQITTANFGKYPVFKECSNVAIDSLENCFNYTLQQFIYTNFKTPDIKYCLKMNINYSHIFRTKLTPKP